MNETITSVGDPIFEDSSTTAALNRVKHCLNYALKEQYNIEDPEVTEKFLKMHGLSKQHFDFVSNFENLIEKGIADESVDTNANKSAVSITGLQNEVAQPLYKLVGYRYLYRKMKELYGKKRAKFLAGEMYTMSIALADSTNILKCYCWSLNASKLVFEGKPWGNVFSAPPKRVDSYTSQLQELVHQLSCHVAGAIAIGSFFMDLAHVYLYREHKTLTELKDNPEIRKDMENSIQSFVYSVNHLSRNGVESPFTNVSVFDRPKLRSLIGPDNMSWYFEKEDPVDGVPTRALEDCQKDWMEYVIDVITEFQEIYMNIMDKGDPLQDNKPFTFPVSTINISRQKNRLGNYEFADREYADYVCKHHDIVRYNIYISDGTKISSCCFSSDQPFLYYTGEGNKVSISFEDFAKEYLPMGSAPAEVHLEHSGKYVQDPESGEMCEITGVLRLENMFKKLYEFEFEDGSKLKVTPNQKLWDKNSQKLVLASEIAENPDLFDI